MSPVRTFKSIDEQISNSHRRDSALTMAERSDANAKDATQSFSKEEQNPLGTDTNKESKPGITFAAQDKLPKLPIPDLEATCKRYLASLDPLQTAREHHDSERAVDDFLRGEGPDLQAKLKAYSEGKSSYIEQFCMLYC
jgi:carnitine O-acetyltransferase